MFEDVDLEITGLVEFGDEFRCTPNLEPGAVLVDGQDIVMMLHDREGPVGLYVDGKLVAEGPVETRLGYGDQTGRPMLSDKCLIDGQSLVNILNEWRREEITLQIQQQDG